MMTSDQEKQFFYSHKFKIKGRIFHPALVKTKMNKEGTKENFNVMFAWKPEENPEVTKQLGEFMQKCYQTWYPTVPMEYFVNPIKKYETYRRQDGKPNPDYLKGHLWVNAASGKQVPPVVVKQGPMGLVQLTEADEAEVYSGRNAVIEISFYRIKTQKQGLSTNVNAVLLLEGGEKMASGMGGGDINQIFGSFVQDTMPSQPQAVAAAPAQPGWTQPATATATATQQTTPPPFNVGGGFV